MGNMARAACLVGVFSWVEAGCGTASHGTGATEPQAVAPALPPTPRPAQVPQNGLTDATVIQLAQLRTETASYEWFQFKPRIRKLILSGAPDSRHISVLWYGYEGKPGSVPVHYHDKTESIFVIEGAQSDAKAKYEKGSFYFNPPGSSHDVFDSSGLFLLSYAAPPDFKRGTDIQPYENVRVGADYAQLPLAPCADGSLCHALPLAADGGMQSRFVKPREQAVEIQANLLLVLKGSCVIAGQPIAADTLVVTKNTAPSAFQVAAVVGECLFYEMAFAP